MQTMMVSSPGSIVQRLAAGFRSLSLALCAMFWLTKQILLLIVAIQLAAPAGWCCRAEMQSSASGERTVRRCCAQHDSPRSSPRPVSGHTCCCPKAATVAKSVVVPAGDDSSASPGFSLSSAVAPAPRLAKSVLSRRSSGWIEHRSCARHVELCVWRC